MRTDPLYQEGEWVIFNPFPPLSKRRRMRVVASRWEAGNQSYSYLVDSGDGYRTMVLESGLRPVPPLEKLAEQAE